MSGDRPALDTGRDRFFFVHLQKSAGTTMRMRLARYFGADAVYPNGREDARNVFYVIASVDHLLERMRVRGDQVRVIAGHYPLCTLDLLGGVFRTFTVLREPVERTLSYLRHHRQNWPEDRHKSLEEIYDDPLRFHGLAHNHMTKMFSLTIEEMTDDMLTRVEFTPERVERAKENLAAVEMVGVQDRFEEFCRELNDHFGWRLGDQPRFANMSEPVQVPDSLRKRIIEDQAADVELYEFALELCDRHREASARHWYVPAIPGPPPNAPVEADVIRQQIDILSEANRRSRDPELERRLLRLRYQAGVQLCREAAGPCEGPTPDFEALDGAAALPETNPDELTPELLRAAILSRGALLVRSLVDPDEAAHLVEEIKRAFAAREAGAHGGGANDGYYEEFSPEPERFGYMSRGLVREGGIWPADSPRLMFEMLETFEGAGLRRIAHEYMGGPPALSIQKSTLRKVTPEVGHGFAGWHQDGAFLGNVRALNVWLSLSHCGDDAPGLDLVARRFDHIVPTGTEGAVFDWVVSPTMVEEVAAGAPILRPIFEPGDVMLFDELFLHASGTDPSMSKVRFAIESWFFGPSAFPGNYTPLAA
jgi:Sulfotransferase family